MNTKEKLNQLSDFRSGLDVINMDKQAVIDSVLTPEIKQKLQDIEAEFSGQTASLSERISALEKEVKEEVIAGGETVKGDHIMAVFTKGRVSWDTKALDGFVVAHPEVEQFRKVGEPSVSIRSI